MEVANVFEILEDLAVDNHLAAEKQVLVQEFMTTHLEVTEEEQPMVDVEQALN